MNETNPIWRHRRRKDGNGDGTFAIAVKRPQVTLLDPDTRRRAEVSHALSLAGIFAEPFGEAAELPEGAIHKLLIIADVNNTLERMLAMLQARVRDVRFLAYSERVQAQDVVNAIRRGALNYFCWPSDCPQMALAIEQIADGEPEPASSDEAWTTKGRDEYDLTERESDILSRIGAGQSLSEISSLLGISKGTVAAHRANIVRKLGVRDAREAAMMHALSQHPGASASSVTDIIRTGRELGRGKYRHPGPSDLYRNQVDIPPGDLHVQISLTPRELEIVRHIYEGLSVKSIARLLDISNRTVESHKASIYRKLNVKNNASLVRALIENNIL